MKALKLLFVITILLTPFLVSGQQEDVIDNKNELIEAAKNCNYASVSEVLKNGFSVNATDEYGKTALHWAIVCGNPEVIKLLLFYNADVQIADFNGMKPIDYARLFEQNEIVMILQDKVKENISM